MKPAYISDIYGTGTNTTCTCWKVTRRDGVVIGATSLDHKLVIDGVTYTSQLAYNASDIESSKELNPDNLELQGILGSPGLRDEDIYSGLWDYAKVEIFRVNYNDLSKGKDIIRVGTLGELRGGRSRFVAEFRGLLQAYSKTIVSVVTKDCPHDLGVGQCQFDVPAVTVGGVIDTVSENRIIYDATRTEPADHFTYGKLTMTSGLNSGLSMEVKLNTVGTLELVQPFYHPLVTGDTYVVHQGCDKSRDRCKALGQILNFGGFHDLPGHDIYKQGGIEYGEA